MFDSLNVNNRVKKCHRQSLITFKSEFLLKSYDEINPDEIAGSAQEQFCNENSTQCQQ